MNLSEFLALFVTPEQGDLVKRQREYPATVAEILDDNMQFQPEVLAALEHFRDSKPYKGTVMERAGKVVALYEELSAFFNIPVPLLSISAKSGDLFCHYQRVTHHIMLNDKLSIVTALHEYGHALGMNERETCGWSINLFRKFFPEAYAKLEPRGHQLFRKPK